MNTEIKNESERALMDAVDSRFLSNKLEAEPDISEIDEKARLIAVVVEAQYQATREIMAKAGRLGFTRKQFLAEVKVPVLLPIATFLRVRDLGFQVESMPMPVAQPIPKAAPTLKIVGG